MRFSRLNQTTNNEREAKKRKHGWIAASSAAQHNTTQHKICAIPRFIFSKQKRNIYKY